MAVFGGEGKSRQLDALEEGCDILVATPGRLLELLECRQATRCDFGILWVTRTGLLQVDVGHVSMLILDEADKMLELGFEEQLDKVTATVSVTVTVMVGS